MISAEVRPEGILAAQSGELGRSGGLQNSISRPKMVVPRLAYNLEIIQGPKHSPVPTIRLRPLQACPHYSAAASSASSEMGRFKRLGTAGLFLGSAYGLR